MACALAPHHGQGGAQHVHQAEHIGGELALDGVCADLFEIAELAVARVIHQDVDAAEAFDGRLHGLFGLRFAGDVQFDQRDVLRRDVGIRFAQRRQLAAGGDDPVAGLQRSAGDVGADTAAGAGDEPYLTHLLSPRMPPRAAAERDKF